jgi:pimeloyl-ACP methyl ester carboxylesterase
MTTSLLFIHGMWTTALFWENYSNFFMSKGYDTKAVTLLYHGDSKSRLKDIGVMDYVKQVEADISKMTDKPIIIGHSMGALIAQKLAEKDLAAKLILIAPSAPEGISVMKLSVLRTFSANICTTLLKKPFIIPPGNAIYGLMNTMSQEEQTAIYRDFVYESGLAAYEIVRGRIAIDDSKVTCPVLVIAGGQDKVTPPKVAKKVANKYNALYREFPEHCHFSMVKGLQWEKVARDLYDWVKE